MCNQSLQEEDLFMGLQSYRWKTLNYVLQTGLKKLLAAPRVQQEPVIWSSRHVVHSVLSACSFLFLLQSHTVFRSAIPVRNAGVCVCTSAPSPWEAGKTQGCWVGPRRGRQQEHGLGSIFRGWPAMWQRAKPGSAVDALGEEFTLNCSARFGLFSSRISSSWVQSSKWNQFQTDICNYLICTCKGVLGFGSSALDFFCLLLGHSYWHR